MIGKEESVQELRRQTNADRLEINDLKNKLARASKRYEKGDTIVHIKLTDTTLYISYCIVNQH